MDVHREYRMYIRRMMRETSPNHTFTDNFTFYSEQLFKKVLSLYCKFKGHRAVFKYGTLTCLRCGAERNVMNRYVEPDSLLFTGSK